jgi:hypothetical protein
MTEANLSAAQLIIACEVPFSIITYSNINLQTQLNLLGLVGYASIRLYSGTRIAQDTNPTWCYAAAPKTQMLIIGLTKYSIILTIFLLHSLEWNIKWFKHISARQNLSSNLQICLGLVFLDLSNPNTKLIQHFL